MPRISRYPIVFDSDSVDLGGFVEQISAEAVDRTIRNTKADLPALFGHDSNKVLGRRAAGTLTLEKREGGLLVTVDASSDVTFARDFIEVTKRGDAPGGSFGFQCIADDWTLEDGIAHRTVLDMVLREVSFAVAFPAYPLTATLRGEGVLSGRLTSRRTSQAVASAERLVRQWQASLPMDLEARIASQRAEAARLRRR